MKRTMSIKLILLKDLFFLNDFIIKFLKWIQKNYKEKMMFLAFGRDSSLLTRSTRKNMKRKVTNYDNLQEYGCMLAICCLQRILQFFSNFSNLSFLGFIKMFHVFFRNMKTNWLPLLVCFSSTWLSPFFTMLLWS